MKNGEKINLSEANHLNEDVRHFTYAKRSGIRSAIPFANFHN